MKLTDIAIRINRERGINITAAHLDNLLKNNANDETIKEVLKTATMGMLGSYKDIGSSDGVEKFVAYVYKILDEAEAEAKELEEIDNAAAGILISSGFNFDGYRIVKYSGYISGDDATQIDRGGIYGKDNGKNLTDALVQIRRQALKELKRAAYDLGCNAVIGVDFDYLTLEPETISGGTHYYEPYVICVTANGNAVIIEKE